VSVVDFIWLVVAAAGVVAGLGALVWATSTGHADRDTEDSSRTYFDEHGHWPGQHELPRPMAPVHSTPPNERPLARPAPPRPKRRLRRSA